MYASTLTWTWYANRPSHATTADALQEGPEPEPAAALDPPGGQPAEGLRGRLCPGRPAPLLLPLPAGPGRYGETRTWGGALWLGGAEGRGCSGFNALQVNLEPKLLLSDSPTLR